VLIALFSVGWCRIPYGSKRGECNDAFDPQTNVVGVLVCRVRNKVEKGFDKKLIKTLRGMGYVLEGG
jgi:DNA-binding response OmpR family regulator